MPDIKRCANLFLILMVIAISALILVMILIMTIPARASTSALPDGVSCEQVRSLVAEHGKVKALAWAFEHGLSIRQIYIIRRTCKV